MNTRPESYTDQDTHLQGHLATPNHETPLPCVLIAHPWRGLDEFCKQKAEDFAALGYVGFALDMYGEGIYATDTTKAAALMRPFAQNRLLLRQRVQAAFDHVSQLPCVDPARISIVGYCFGGMVALELARNGAPLCGAVSVHGLLSAPLPAQPDQIQASILIQHGQLDPMVSTEEIRALEHELTHAKVDWQLHIYGDAMHAFTNPEIRRPEDGVAYHPKAATRSWNAILNFLEECT